MGVVWWFRGDITVTLVSRVCSLGLFLGFVPCFCSLLLFVWFVPWVCSLGLFVGFVRWVCSSGLFLGALFVPSSDVWSDLVFMLYYLVVCVQCLYCIVRMRVYVLTSCCLGSLIVLL